MSKLYKYIDIHSHHRIPADVLGVYNHILASDSNIFSPYYSVGIHPWYIDKADIKILEDRLKEVHCLALGECGLDFQSKLLKQNKREVQEEIFSKQIQLAYQYNKPLIIHCVKCFDRLLQIRKKYGDEIPWIIHGYNKKKTLAFQLLDAGFYLSFGSHLITNPMLAEMFKSIPENCFFLETDAQQTYDIKHIYNVASVFRSVALSDLQEKIFLTFEKTFLRRKNVL